MAQPFLLRRAGGGSVVGGAGADVIRSLALPLAALPVHEAVIAFNFLYTVLAADATLSLLVPGGIHRSKAPPGTVTPYVIISFQAASDTLTMNAVRILTLPLMQAKVVGPASNTLAIAQAAAWLDVLLKRTKGAVTGGLILACYRESPLLIDETVSGEDWTNIGGLYRLEIQQL